VGDEMAGNGGGAQVKPKNQLGRVVLAP